MRVAAHVSYGNASPKCPACMGEDVGEFRKLEGCDLVQEFGGRTTDDGGVPLQQYRGRAHHLSITCTRCGGMDAACPTCRGGGEEPIYRCPGSIIDAGSNSIMRAYSAYTKGVLPDVGGLYDQAATFVDCMQTIEAEIAALQAEDRRHSKSKR